MPKTLFRVDTERQEQTKRERKEYSRHKWRNFEHFRRSVCGVRINNMFQWIVNKTDVIRRARTTRKNEKLLLVNWFSTLSISNPTRHFNEKTIGFEYVQIVPSNYNVDAQCTWWLPKLQVFGERQLNVFRKTKKSFYASERSLCANTEQKGSKGAATRAFLLTKFFQSTACWMKYISVNVLFLEP